MRPVLKTQRESVDTSFSRVILETKFFDAAKMTK